MTPGQRVDELSIRKDVQGNLCTKCIPCKQPAPFPHVTQSLQATFPVGVRDGELDKRGLLDPQSATRGRTGIFPMQSSQMNLPSGFQANSLNTFMQVHSIDAS